MFARIATWRLHSDDADAVMLDIAPMTAEVRRQPGFVDGYGVRATPVTWVAVSVWEDEARMHAAAGVIANLVRPLIEDGRLELADAKTGPAERWS